MHGLTLLAIAVFGVRLCSAAAISKESHVQMSQEGSEVLRKRDGFTKEDSTCQHGLLRLNSDGSMTCTHPFGAQRRSADDYVYCLGGSVYEPEYKCLSDSDKRK